MSPTQSVITCAKCGTANPLGRVFCGACGGKLDLGGVNRDLVATRVRTISYGKLVVQVVGAVVLVIVVALVVAFIPQTSMIGVEGSRAGASEIANLSRTATFLQRGQPMQRRVTEANINGFFVGNRSREMKVESFSVDIVSGAIRARMVRTLGPFDVGSWHIQPKFSTECVFIPDNGRLRFGSARQGLLPLVGPFKSAAIRGMYRRLASLHEWSIVKVVSAVQAEDDALNLTLVR